MVSFDGLLKGITLAESWASVPGYEGLYEISTLGNIRSLDRVVTQRGRAGSSVTRTYRGRVMKQQTNTYGYRHVALCKDGVEKTQALHPIVAAVFHGPAPTPDHEAAHWDGNPANNRVENLRWATGAENQADRKRHGTDCRGERHGAATLSEQDVSDCREARLRGVTLATLAARHSVSVQAIHQATTGKNWKHVHERSA